MDKSMHLPHIKAILYLQVAFEALMWSTSHFFFQCHFQRIPVYLTLTLWIPTGRLLAHGLRPIFIFEK